MGRLKRDLTAAEEKAIARRIDEGVKKLLRT